MIDIAKKAAVEAGKFLIERFEKEHSINRKGALDDFSTEADKGAENIILSIITKEFPKHNILSEENGKKENGSEYTWVIDPLDGTIPYSSKLPFFGISIGLLKEGKSILGVINFPKLNSLYWGEAGKGAYLNNKRIYVSTNKQLINCLIGFEWGNIPNRNKRIDKILKPIADNVRYMPCFGCSSLALSYVASGVLDGYIHQAYPWDFVAGSCIIKEAKGNVTDWFGKEINWFCDNPKLIASNGLIHEEILNLMK